MAENHHHESYCRWEYQPPPPPSAAHNQAASPFQYGQEREYYGYDAHWRPIYHQYASPNITSYSNNPNHTACYGMYQASPSSSLPSLPLAVPPPPPSLASPLPPFSPGSLSLRPRYGPSSQPATFPEQPYARGEKNAPNNDENYRLARQNYLETPVPEVATNASITECNLPFPHRLRKMLDEAEQRSFDHVVSWQPDGKSFKVHKSDVFADDIVSRYFNQTKYKSFQRQLNLYGFQRIERGPMKGSYMHKSFNKDEPHLDSTMNRRRPNMRSSNQDDDDSSVHPADIAEVTVSSDKVNAGGNRDDRAAENHLLHKRDGAIPLNRLLSPRDGLPDLLRAASFPQSQGADGSNLDNTKGVTSADPIFVDEFVEDPLFSFPAHDSASNSNVTREGRDIENANYNMALRVKYGPVDPEGLLPGPVPDTNPEKLTTKLTSSVTPPHSSNNLDSESHHGCSPQDFKLRSSSPSSPKSRKPQSARSKAELSFPWKLYDMLEEAEKNGLTDIVSWCDNGTAFKVHKHQEYLDQIMPMYFDQTKYESFRRQLNLYGFTRVCRGPRRGTYMHPHLVRGNRAACREIVRENAKGRA